MNVHDFDDIRPYLPEELPAAFDSLMADSEFCVLMQSFFEGVPFEALKAKLYSCKDSLEVQKVFFHQLLNQLLERCSKGVILDASTLSAEARGGSHTFISNHRDIVLDPALLSVLLIEHGFRTTVEIAIGDNLLIHPWIKTLVRINKSFIVQRSLGMREMLAASKRMSQYMHFAIREKQENIWIAQREGRAKDSNDRTQESVLKMMVLGGEGSPLESLKEMNLVPLSISYEYDPCDFLKAQEFQQKRDNPEFKKSQQDDLTNMQTGIFGYKGRVVYRMGEPVNTWIDELKELSKVEFYNEVASRIDRSIHLGYELFPANYIALDLLEERDVESTSHYTAEDKATFLHYLSDRLALIQLPNKDEAFLRERILTMYANPLRNHLAARG